MSRFRYATVFSGINSPAVTSKWAKGTGGPSGDECQNLVAEVAQPTCIAFPSRMSGETGKGDGATCVTQGAAVRRLTARECERLQGFPDDFTKIPWNGKPAEQCPDGPRYRAIGNSMATNMMRWIGLRIAAVHAIPFKKP